MLLPCLLGFYTLAFAQGSGRTWCWDGGNEFSKRIAFFSEIYSAFYFCSFTQGTRSNFLAHHWWKHSIPKMAKRQHKGLTRVICTIWAYKISVLGTGLHHQLGLHMLTFSPPVSGWLHFVFSCNNWDLLLYSKGSLNVVSATLQVWLARGMYFMGVCLLC